MNVSVIICTHNPRRDYLESTLDGLRAQRLPHSDWELLLVDNGSTPALNGSINLSGLSRARVVCEEELGLTPARGRGLKEAVSDLVLYVDDDNVLAPNYLENVVRIGQEWPMLGAWGAGDLRGVFEQKPPDWMKPHLWYVTVHKVNQDRWTNRPDLSCFPAGAGLAVRKRAAQPYFDLVGEDAFRRSLDRRGSNLSSCGDMDLLWTMTESGWGVGRFTCLALDHLIASRRVEEGYFMQMVANQWCSNVLLHYLHGRCDRRQPPGGYVRRLREWRYERGLEPLDRKLHRAQQRGRQHAEGLICQLEMGARNVRQELV